jgi:PleD family two-component response regulator
LESGADGYLTKPFDPEELKARLRTGTRILDLEDRLIEAREQMRFQATHDALTSLWNRGVIMELLARELTRSRREGKCTAVLLGDIDHFKNINDTYGHLGGDEVLKETAPACLVGALLRLCRAVRWRGIFGYLEQLRSCFWLGPRGKNSQNHR